MRVRFTIPGKPFGKQRHRVSFKQRRTFNTAANEAFEQVVGVIGSQHFPAPLEGPVRVHISAIFAPAASWSQKKRAAHMHRPHCQKPDADNVAKAICDGLNRIAWADDSQVAEITVSKYWGLRDETHVAIEPMDWREADDYAALHQRLIGGE